MGFMLLGTICCVFRRLTLLSFMLMFLKIIFKWQMLICYFLFWIKDMLSGFWRGFCRGVFRQFFESNILHPPSIDPKFSHSLFQFNINFSKLKLQNFVFKYSHFITSLATITAPSYTREGKIFKITCTMSNIWRNEEGSMFICKQMRENLLLSINKMIAAYHCFNIPDLLFL